jgi:hypothetical protein
LTFAWNPIDNVLAYRLEIERSDNGEPVLQAVVQQGIASYAAPPWLAERAGGGELRWRVVALGPGGGPVEESPWRSMVFESAPEE